MQTLNPYRQRGSPSSAASNPTLPPTTPSSRITSHYPSIFGSTVPRSSRRPGTNPGPATSDASFGRPSFGNSAFVVKSESESESPPPLWSARRAFPFEEDVREGGGGSRGPGLPKLLRKRSLGRRPSLGNLRSSSPEQPQSASPFVSRFKSLRRRASSSVALLETYGSGAAFGSGKTIPVSVAIIDNSSPPALPEYALSSAAKLSRDTDGILSPQPSSQTASHSMDTTGTITMQSNGRMISRTGTMPTNGSLSAGSGMMPPPSSLGMQSESAMVHQHIQDMANKRISTLEYLRKAHEGRVYWFNTLLFDKPDLARMPYFDTRRLARRATNYLLLGLSLPTVIDLNSATPLEFLRSLNLLLSEFDTFQSLHPETGGGSSGLGRARIPNLNVFRRATPSAKARRSSSANNEVLYEDGAMPNGSGVGSFSGAASSTAGTSIMNGLGGSASVVSFGQSEADLLPGEEYVHLLTPSLPFDPDFFETFATLCDVLIDAYTRLLSLLRTPRECTAAVAELFTKADARVRKIIVQGIVKEFEDTSRNGVRTEVANVGKIVLGGLM